VAFVVVPSDHDQFHVENPESVVVFVPTVGALAFVVVEVPAVVGVVVVRA
jgi:hypothetical protein